MDPHHHLIREEATILVIGSRAWKDLKRLFALVTYLLAMTQEGHSSKSISPQQSWSRQSLSFLILPPRARSPPHSMYLAAPTCLPQWHLLPKLIMLRTPSWEQPQLRVSSSPWYSYHLMSGPLTQLGTLCLWQPLNFSFTLVTSCVVN